MVYFMNRNYGIFESNPYNVDTVNIGPDGLVENLLLDL